MRNSAVLQAYFIEIARNILEVPCHALHTHFVIQWSRKLYTFNFIFIRIKNSNEMSRHNTYLVFPVPIPMNYCNPHKPHGPWEWSWANVGGTLVVGTHLAEPT